MMEAKKKQKITLTKYEVSTVGMLAAVLLPTFVVLVLQVFQDALSGGMHNIRIYFVTGIVFLAMLIAAGCFFNRHGSEIAVPVYFVRFFLGGVFVCNLLFLAICYHTSPTVYPALSGEWLAWHHKTEWKVYLFMDVIGAAGIFLVAWFKKKKKLTDWLRYPVYLSAGIAGGSAMYCGNYLVSDKLHGTAYYTSVYNALMNAPYDYSNQSIYGHYAIFLKYPIKWLGGSYTAFNLVMAIVGGLSIFIFAMALDMCLHNHFISMIGAWSIPLMYQYYPRNHWQMFPHRVLFGGIELFLLALLFKKQKKRFLVIGYAVCSLAMLWNMETGIVCLGVWCLAGILYEDKANASTGLHLLPLLKCSIRNAVYAVFSVMGMLVVFNLYNMSLGEKWHGLRFVLYPYLANWDTPEILVAHAAEKTAAEAVGILTSSSTIDFGFTSTFSLSLSQQISSWYFVVLLLVSSIVLGTVRRIYGRVKDVDYIMVLSAVLALGHLTYFINRPGYDYLAIAFFESVLIMAVLADEALDASGGLALIKRVYQYLFIAILSVLSVFSAWQTVYRISTRADMGYYAQEEFDELLNEIRETVPEDAIAIGTGSHEIYAQLGRNTGNYVLDFPDMGGNEHVVAQLHVNVSKQQNYLVSLWEKTSGDKMPVEQFMAYWGVQPESITVVKHWDMGYDSGTLSILNIYYLEIDQTWEHNHMDRYEEIYKTDQNSKRK